MKTVRLCLLVVLSSMFCWCVLAGPGEPAATGLGNPPQTEGEGGRAGLGVADGPKAPDDESVASYVALTLSSARQLYHQGYFDRAILYLDRAKRLTGRIPQFALSDVEALLRDCTQASARKERLLEGLRSGKAPKAPKAQADLGRAVAQLVESKYKEGDKSLQRREFAQAAEAFEAVWLLAGDHRGAWSRLSQAREAVTAIGSGLAESEKLAQAQKWNEARAALEKVLQIDPKNSAARQSLAKVAAARQKQIEALISAGEQHVAEKRWEEARSTFQSVLQIAPDNRDAADHLSRLDKARKAETDRVARVKEESARQKERERSSQISAALDEAARLVRGRQWDAARVAIDKALQLDSENARAREMLAQAEAGRKADADRLAQEQTRQQAETQKRQQQAQIEATLAEGRRLLQSSQWDEAKTQFEKALQIDSNNRQAKTLLAQIERDRKQAADRVASEQAEQKQRELKQQIETLSAQGAKAREEGKWDEARQAYESVLQLEAANRTAQRALAALDGERKAQAERLAREQQARQLEEARRLAEQQENEKQKQIADALAEATRLLEAKQWDGAQTACDKVLSLDPENRKAKRLASTIETDRKAEADRLVREQAEQKDRLLKQQIETLLAQATKAREQSKWDEARQAFESVLQLESGNRTAQRALSTLESDRKAEADRLVSEQQARQLEEARRLAEQQENEKQKQIADALAEARDCMKQDSGMAHKQRATKSLVSIRKIARPSALRPQSRPTARQKPTAWCVSNKPGK